MYMLLSIYLSSLQIEAHIQRTSVSHTHTTTCCAMKKNTVNGLRKIISLRRSHNHIASDQHKTIYLNARTRVLLIRFYFFHSYMSEHKQHIHICIPIENSKAHSKSTHILIPINKITTTKKL